VVSEIVPRRTVVPKTAIFVQDQKRGTSPKPARQVLPERPLIQALVVVAAAAALVRGLVRSVCLFLDENDVKRVRRETDAPVELLDDGA
jgi:hypothetical protein